jgi:hypothetical protein
MLPETSGRIPVPNSPALLPLFQDQQPFGRMATMTGCFLKVL